MNKQTEGQEKLPIIPKIVNATDIRYRWSSIVNELEEEGTPVLVLERSTPKAVIFPYSQTKDFIARGTEKRKSKDPLTLWRKKYAHRFKGFDATAVIRRMRDTRWNLSSMPQQS